MLLIPTGHPDSPSRRFTSRRRGWLLVLVCLVALLAVGALSVAAAGPSSEAVLDPAVQIEPQPMTSQVVERDEFMVEVWIDAGEHEVNAADIHLAFDPTYLALTMAPVPSPALPVVPANLYDNEAGTIDFGAYRTGGDAATGRFLLCTLHFEAREATPPEGTAITEGKKPVVSAPKGVPLDATWSDATVDIEDYLMMLFMPLGYNES